MKQNKRSRGGTSEYVGSKPLDFPTQPSAPHVEGKQAIYSI